jgi:hypothetical protein
LRHGEWNGEQLVPAKWIETATAAHVRAGTLSDAYGYQWWSNGIGYVMALGFGGQYIVVVPDHDLVVAFTSGLPGNQFGEPEQLTNYYVVGAIASEHPLPPNPDASSRLAAAIAAAGATPEPVPVGLPEMAAAIDGARYEFRDNDFGNDWFTISFADGAAVLGFKDVDGPIEVVVGLDGRFVTDEAWGRPWAWRGAWAQDDTFVIEYQTIGHTPRGTFQLTFDDDVAHLLFREVATGANQSSTADRVG